MRERERERDREIEIETLDGCSLVGKVGDQEVMGPTPTFHSDI